MFWIVFFVASLSWSGDTFLVLDGYTMFDVFADKVAGAWTHEGLQEAGLRIPVYSTLSLRRDLGIRFIVLYVY